MSLAKLGDDLSSVPQFINSCFDLDTRSMTDVIEAASQGAFFYSFVDPTSRGLILNAWLAAWKASQGDKTADQDALKWCPQSDAWVIKFLADYIKSLKLVLCVPALTVPGLTKDSTKQIYVTNGYSRHGFFDSDGEWNYGAFESDGRVSKGGYDYPTVATFLQYFFYGAHFVIPISSKENKGAKIVNFYDHIKTTWKYTPDKDGQFHLSDTSPWRDGVTSSHYVATGLGMHWFNFTGIDYLDIETDAEPSGNPLICAMLSGKTADSGYDTFLQLEGWQLHSSSKDTWHMIDYDSHKATIWNFSTFGACAYSEKRCTPIFLAPSTFSTDISKDTHMPLYVGAGNHQNWMDTDLLQLGPGIG